MKFSRSDIKRIMLEEPDNTPFQEAVLDFLYENQDLFSHWPEDVFDHIIHTVAKVSALTKLFLERKLHEKIELNFKACCDFFKSYANENPSISMDAQSAIITHAVTALFRADSYTGFVNNLRTKDINRTIKNVLANVKASVSTSYISSLRQQLSAGNTDKYINAIVNQWKKLNENPQLNALLQCESGSEEKCTPKMKAKRQNLFRSYRLIECRAAQLIQELDTLVELLQDFRKEDTDVEDEEQKEVDEYVVVGNEIEDAATFAPTTSSSDPGASPSVPADTAAANETDNKVDEVEAVDAGAMTDTETSTPTATTSTTADITAVTADDNEAPVEAATDRTPEVVEDVQASKVDAEAATAAVSEDAEVEKKGDSDDEASDSDAETETETASSDIDTTMEDEEYDPPEVIATINTVETEVEANGAKVDASISRLDELQAKYNTLKDEVDNEDATVAHEKLFAVAVDLERTHRELHLSGEALMKKLFVLDGTTVSNTLRPRRKGLVSRIFTLSDKVDAAKARFTQLRAEVDDKVKAVRAAIARYAEDKAKKAEAERLAREEKLRLEREASERRAKEEMEKAREARRAHVAKVREERLKAEEARKAQEQALREALLAERKAREEEARVHDEEAKADFLAQLFGQRRPTKHQDRVDRVEEEEEEEEDARENLLRQALFGQHSHAAQAARERAHEEQTQRRALVERESAQRRALVEKEQEKLRERALMQALQRQGLARGLTPEQIRALANTAQRSLNERNMSGDGNPLTPIPLQKRTSSITADDDEEEMLPGSLTVPVPSRARSDANTLMLSPEFWQRLTLHPRIDTDQDHQFYTAVVHLPSLKHDTVQVQVDDDSLSLSGVCAPSAQEQARLVSRLRATAPGASKTTLLHALAKLAQGRFGKFERTLQFPEDADLSRAKATHRDDVLVIRVPRRRRQPTYGYNGYAPFTSMAPPVRRGFGGFGGNRGFGGSDFFF